MNTDDKKNRVLHTQKKRINRKLLLIISAVALVIIAAVSIIILQNKPKPNTQIASNTTTSKSENNSNAGQASNIEDEVITLPVSDFADGKAKYYAISGKGSTINFFALKSSDGIIRTAFDACDVCYASKKGYRQEEDWMVCNNCGQKFSSVKINEERGGCNPSPLDRVISGDNLILKLSDIAAGAKYF